jgi:hypothetical protein
MSAKFQWDLRDARQHGVFTGTMYLTCDNSRGAVGEVVLNVREGLWALPFQLALLCCRCREPLQYHELEG